MKKRIALVAIFITALLFSAGCGNQDQTAGLNEQQILEKAVTNTLNAESVQVDASIIFKVDSEFQPIDAELKGFTKIFAEPLVIENNHKVINKAIGMEEEIRSYIHFMQGQLTGYVLQDRTWYILEEVIRPDDLRNNPLQNLPLFINNPAEGTAPVRNTDSGNGPANSIRFDLEGDVSIFEQVLQQNVLNLSLGSFAQDPLALEALGNFAMSVWVDKGTLQVVRMEMDFTENLASLAAYLESSETAPENVYDLFANFTYQVVYTLKDFNNVAKVTVPLEARVGTRLN